MEQFLKKFLALSREIGVACAAALQFLTVVLPLIRRPFSDKEMGLAVGCFPLVGLLLGCVLALLNLLFKNLFPGVETALVLAAWVLLTGALHVDGFLDCCDGLFGGKNPEERLNIMRDSHVGAFAVVGGVLLLLVKFAALCAIGPRWTALLLAPTLARWTMACCIVAFPYARIEGKGKVLKDNTGWIHLGLATILVAIATPMIALFAWNFFILLIPAITLLAGWLAAKWVMTRIPGLTGDVYGAICELMEVLVLLLFVFFRAN